VTFSLRCSLLFTVLVVSIVGPALPQSEFRWISETKHSKEWSRVAQAFAEELKGALGHGYTARGIDRIGLFDGTALVLVRYDSRPEPYEPIHRIYNYQLDGRAKTVIRHVVWDQEVDVWSGLDFVGVANFDPRAPDLVFSHQDCRDCEATYFLSALHYSDGLWSVRVWPGDAQDVMVDSDLQFNDYIWKFACAHRIWDSDGDGLDELAVYCRVLGLDWETGEVKEEEDHVVFYDPTDGVMRGGQVDSADQRAELLIQVCADVDAPDLCRN